ncbi:MAG: hypothetical protein I3I94_09235 [Acidaminococcaceae bacterium]|nr:hypothetical protein [Acidaminococcaceae bacterium]HCJ91204.1 hypothetical protein [Acidaminococcaceae bacterium]
MQTRKEKVLAIVLSTAVFAAPFVAAAPAYADPQLEQIQPQKETATAENGEPLSFKERLKAKMAQAEISKMPAGEAYIPGGTQLNVELVTALHSKTARTGDIVRFKMMENLILNDVIVVPAGAEVEGKVTKATSSGFFGRAGKLIFSIDKVRTINGVDIPLEYMGKIQAGSDGGAIAVTAVVSILGGFLMKGKNVSIPAGTKFAAKVKNDTDLKTSLKDLQEAMNPEKPHGVSISIR